MNVYLAINGSRAIAYKSIRIYFDTKGFWLAVQKINLGKANQCEYISWHSLTIIALKLLQLRFKRSKNSEKFFMRYYTEHS